MKAEERRRRILEILSERRSEIVENIACEFSVSMRTIYSDIFFLSLSYPIYTVSGKYGGGIYVDEDWFLGKEYLSEKQEALLNMLKENLDGENLKVMETILNKFTKKRKINPNQKIG